MIYPIIAAVAPVVVLLFYIYRKDEFQKEPVKELLKAFALGIASTVASLLISIPSEIIGLYSGDNYTVWGVISSSFFGAAIPEEIAKFFMFWLLVRKNRHFDEHMDGIVYASVVALGFACLENVLYVVGDEVWVSVGVMRALFSVPGHMFFGILMGYYYSLVRFDPFSTVRDKVLVLGAPILAHGIFNSILSFDMLLPQGLGVVIMIVFVVFCNSLRKQASRRIRTHLMQDGLI